MPYQKNGAHIGMRPTFSNLTVLSSKMTKYNGLEKYSKILKLSNSLIKSVSYQKNPTIPLLKTLWWRQRPLGKFSMTRPICYISSFIAQCEMSVKLKIWLNVTVSLKKLNTGIIPLFELAQTCSRVIGKCISLTVRDRSKYPKLLKKN